MVINLENVIDWFILPLLVIAVVIVFIRLVKGPELPDRVVSLDLMTSIGIGIIATYAMATGEKVLIDVAIILALISFLGTVAFAYYIERRAS